jgi:L-alanine-DL-glutamate epimerase-like enolase superfamily enzyme
MAGRGVKLTEATIERAAHVVSEVRKAVGNGVQICVDHFGESYLTSDEVIRLGRALEKYDLAWMEDPVSRMDIPGHKKVADALLTPIAAGEDLYLRDGFREAIRTRAFDIVHPDLLTSGGLMETKRIADDAEEEEIPTALHCAGSPIGFMANIHTAAAISSFLACEHHGLDLPFWESLVTGLDPQYMADGYVTVPEKPGLGIDLNLEAIEANLRTPGTMFLPTDTWNTPKLGFWRPDNRWPE